MLTSSTTNASSSEPSYRMSHTAFVKLQELLGDRIQLSSRFSSGVEPIPVQIVMASGLRWLSGCPCLWYQLTVSISVSGYLPPLCSQFNTAGIEIGFPHSGVEIKRATDAFRAQSKSGIIAGCVGCIDGYLAIITQP